MVEDVKKGRTQNDLTWITVRVIKSDPVIGDLTEKVKAAKEGEYKIVLISFYTCFFLFYLFYFFYLLSQRK